MGVSDLGFRVYGFRDLGFGVMFWVLEHWCLGIGFYFV